MHTYRIVDVDAMEVVDEIMLENVEKMVDRERMFIKFRKPNYKIIRLLLRSP